MSNNQKFLAVSSSYGVILGLYCYWYFLILQSLRKKISNQGYPFLRIIQNYYIN